MEIVWKIAAAVVAVAAGLYVRLWLLKSQGTSIFHKQPGSDGIL
jgi:hypothetical protein